MTETVSIGKIAVMAALGTEASLFPPEQVTTWGYQVLRSHVGCMDSAKIFAAVETAAKKEALISTLYREEHALYHSILDAYTAICRGQEGLGGILRTVGLTYSIVRGPRTPQVPEDGQWLAVVLYGSIGAPVKGFEHEVIGMGINPV